MVSVDSNDDEIVREAVGKAMVHDVDFEHSFADAAEAARHAIDLVREQEVAPLRNDLGFKSIELSQMSDRLQGVKKERDTFLSLLREVRPHIGDEYQRNWPNDDAFYDMLARVDAALRGEGGQGGEDRPG